MRKDKDVSVLVPDTGFLIDVDLTKFNLVLENVSLRVSLPIAHVLSLRFNFNDSILLDYLLNCVGEESIEGGDLLGHKPMLLKVSSDDSPGILLSDVVHQINIFFFLFNYVHFNL